MTVPAGHWKMFVGNLPENANEDRVREYFESKYGSVKEVHFCFDHNRNFRRFGFVTFADAVAPESVTRETHELDGNELRTGTERNSSGRDQADARKLFVTGFGDDATEDDLRSFAVAVGEVHDVHMPQARSQARGKYAFISMSTTEDATKLLELVDPQVKGVALTIRRAEPRRERQQHDKGMGKSWGGGWGGGWNMGQMHGMMPMHMHEGMHMHGGHPMHGGHAMHSGHGMPMHGHGMPMHGHGHGGHGVHMHGPGMHNGHMQGHPSNMDMNMMGNPNMNSAEAGHPGQGY